MNCVRSLLVASLISSSVIASVDCKPFVQEKTMAKSEVDSYSAGLEKIYAKLESLERKLETKRALLDSLDAKVRIEKDKMDSIQIQISSIKSQSDGAQSELSQIDHSASTLQSRIAQIERVLEGNLSSSKRRELLREKMRSSMDLEKLLSSRGSLIQIIEDTNRQIEPLRDERNAVKFLRDKLLQDLEQEASAQPTLALLEDKVAKEQILVSDSRAIEASLLAALEEAKEKVLMCRTYNVKYPLVLSIATEIGEVGCAGYEMKQFNSQEKMDAQNEILNSLCPL